MAKKKNAFKNDWEQTPDKKSTPGMKMHNVPLPRVIQNEVEKIAKSYEETTGKKRSIPMILLDLTCEALNNR